MPNLYKKILDQPKAVRRRMAFASTFFIGVIIFSIWLAFSFHSIKKQTSNAFRGGNEEVYQTMPKAPSIKDNFDKMMNYVDEATNSETQNMETVDDYPFSENIIGNQEENLENEDTDSSNNQEVFNAEKPQADNAEGNSSPDLLKDNTEKNNSETIQGNTENSAGNAEKLENLEY